MTNNDALEQAERNAGIPVGSSIPLRDDYDAVSDIDRARTVYESNGWRYVSRKDLP